MKLWFISINRVSDRDYIRYGLDELSKKGVQVNVVDVSDLMWGTEDHKLKNDIFFNIEYCRYLHEFVNIVESLNNDDIVLCGGVLFPKLHSILSVRCKYVGLQTLGAMPAVAKTSVNKFLFYKSMIRTKGFFNKVLRKIYSYYIFKRFPYAFVQRSGYLSSINYPGITGNTKVIESQSYDIYQSLIQKKLIESDIGKSGYFLWIDQAIPYHTDTLKCSGDISHYADSYFSRIKSLLRCCETRYKCKVIVSLHPRIAQDKRYLDAWQGWSVVTGDTTEYIKESKLCLTHNSTAIHAVAYFRKPLILVKDQLLSDYGYDNGIIDSFLAELDCNLVNTECVDSIVDFNFEINKSKYEGYVNKYVCNEQSIKAINADKMLSFMKGIQV